jgi:membrane protein DedA with SNARE-associated domain
VPPVLRRLRPALLALVAARAVLGGVAVLLAPALYRDHVALLVLLRPTKEVLLLAGYVAHEHRVNLLVVVAATIPLLVLGVWLFYVLGRAYSDEIDGCDLPGIAGRLLPPERIAKLREVLGERGWSLVALGRVAVMPSSLVAASAGSSEMPAHMFISADSLGSVASLVLMLGAGWVLEGAHDQAGPWLTVLGVLALLAVLVLLGRKMRSSPVRSEHRKTR